MSVLPNGLVLLWSQWTPEPPGGVQTYARLWNPSGGLTDVHNYSDYIFCSGHSLLPDGRLLVTGGTLNNAYYDGTTRTTIFDYTDNSWKTGADMNLGRWYPTNVALGNGETLVVSGSYCTNGNGFQNCEFFFFNDTPQVWQANGSWRTLTGAVYSLPLYPWMHLASDGRAYYSGPTRYTRFFNTSGSGSTKCGSETFYGNYRDAGSAVMYDVDKILIVGGDNPPVKTAEIINLTEAGTKPCDAQGNTAPPWHQAASMSVERRHLNTTILPDGRVLATGGTRGVGYNNPCVGTNGNPDNAVRIAEIWNPTTNSWSQMAAMSYPRQYHSTAVLLPNGKVLVGGGTYQPGADFGCVDLDNQYTTEIFSPPYLYNPDNSLATRPGIASAPTTATYGQNINVGVQGGAGNAALISKATLVRLSSVTHSFNQNQRFNNLSFTVSGGNLSVTIPSNPNACPPGHYMLFIINSSGVPSVASIIKVS
jgi:hypothetical protein